MMPDRMSRVIEAVLYLYCLTKRSIEGQLNHNTLLNNMEYLLVFTIELIFSPMVCSQIICRY